MPQPLPLDVLFIQQRLDTDAARFRAEMAAEGVSASEASATAPLSALLQLALADKLLLTRMQALVPLPIVLPREGLTAYGTHEGPLIRVCSEMRSQVVGAGESLRAEGALEGGRVLLNALWVAGIRATRRCLVFRVREAENIIALVWNRGC